MTRWHHWMNRALELAALGEGRTSPNPLVGAVVLDAAGELVGEGFHARAGEPHAEVGALSQAGGRARGGTLVVTLEPCCHHGRTPPCSEAVIGAGVARVVVALTDPDPRVSGQGLAMLRAAGVEVLTGVGEEGARRQNRAFLHRCQEGRPLGILKWAMSLDGRTALPNGQSQWISGSAARRWVHGLRAACDAVIVGGGTVRADNPRLTSRGVRQPEPLRVVLSRELELPALRSPAFAGSPGEAGMQPGALGMRPQPGGGGPERGLCAGGGGGDRPQAAGRGSGSHPPRSPWRGDHGRGVGAPLGGAGLVERRPSLARSGGVSP